MRIIKEPFLKAQALAFPQAAAWLQAFRAIARAAEWKSIVDLRRDYPHADAVTVKSGRTVIVLNVAGNKYRLLVAVHFNVQTVFTLRFLTHIQYSKGRWKSEL
jgi:mRNA interferase HigB